MSNLKVAVQWLDNCRALHPNDRAIVNSVEQGLIELSAVDIQIEQLRKELEQVKKERDKHTSKVVMQFASEVWNQLLVKYKTLKVMPLTMAEEFNGKRLAQTKDKD